MKEALTFFDYLGVVLRYRKLVFGITFLAAAVVFLFGITSKPTFVAETRLWSSEPQRTAEFIKSPKTLNRVIERLGPLKDHRINEPQILRKVITFSVEAGDPILSANIANAIVAESIKREIEFSASVLENQKNLFEEQLIFTKQALDNNKIVGVTDFSGVSLRAPSELSFMTVLNEATPPAIGGSRLFSTIAKSLFAALLGLFFGILLAFTREYALRHRENWEEMKREYLSR